MTFFFFNVNKVLFKINTNFTIFLFIVKNCFIAKKINDNKNLR